MIRCILTAKSTVTIYASATWHSTLDAELNSLWNPEWKGIAKGSPERVEADCALYLAEVKAAQEMGGIDATPPG